MDPLTAFSLACGVIQVVDFSIKVTSKCRELYKYGALESNKEIESMSEYLTDIRSSVPALRCRPGPWVSAAAFRR